MKKHLDGGRAFPCDQIVERDADGHLHGNDVSSGGMMLRDYFMAHAPAEPQHWFQPVMPPCPPDASKPEDLTLEERMEINGHRNETLDLEDMKEPRAIAYVKDSSEAWDLQTKWRTEQGKQLWVQWPAAWADEQLKAREA